MEMTGISGGITSSEYMTLLEYLNTNYRGYNFNISLICKRDTYSYLCISEVHNWFCKVYFSMDISEVKKKLLLYELIREKLRDGIVPIPKEIFENPVRIGNGIGVFFEMCTSICNSDNIVDIVLSAGKMLRKLHSINTAYVEHVANSTLLCVAKDICSKDYLTTTEKDILRKAERQVLLIKKKAEEENRIVVVHGDYCIRNLMKRNGQVVMVDYDTFSIGSAYLDIGRFCLELLVDKKEELIDLFAQAYYESIEKNHDLHGMMLYSLWMKVMWYLDEIDKDSDPVRISRVKYHINWLQYIMEEKMDGRP